MSYTLTILTPTYNRAYILPQLYESLLKQTEPDFIWMIVDDGSTDETENLIKGYILEKKICIVYIKQVNGGKHRAINTGAKQIVTDATFIVDSDDYLTDDAVENILSNWNHVVENGLMGISFLRGYSEKQVIGEKFPDDFLIENFNNMRYNRGIKGDKAEIVDSNILKQTPFPSIPNEKFMSEGVVWKELSHKGKSLFINKIIYITEYLEDGLTHSGRLLLIKNPLGAMLNAKLAMTNEFKKKLRIQNSLLYIAYGFFAKKKVREIITESGQRKLVRVNLLFGWMIYVIWKIKYKL
ncbi:sugar transferase [Lactococcus lactis]|uniref:glycosyltransferase family A protein n=1 Tax=Lactococcus lactis TaxID=1358 RepID=UPI000A1FA4B6|nr:glycosyltransferase family 2 protein [Lactococcus lactis]OSP88038.1 sugar transferase [Lactococcus lactis]